MEDLDLIFEFVDKYYPTGSNYICNPPVENTDIDYICLVDNFVEFNKTMETYGWKNCADEKGRQYSNNVFAYRKGKYNLIVTEYHEVYIKWCAATELCKALNLTNKADRINTFDIVINA